MATAVNPRVFNDILADINSFTKDLLRMQYKNARLECRINQFLFWVFMFVAMCHAILYGGWIGVFASVSFCLLAGVQLLWYKRARANRDKFLMEIMAE